MTVRAMRITLVILSLSLLLTSRIYGQKQKNIFKAVKVDVPYDDADYRLQLYSEVVDMPFGFNDEGHQLFYKVQNAGNPFLYLGPNEVFFNPGANSLRVYGARKNPDMVLNQNKEYDYVGSAKDEGDALFWGFKTAVAGDILGEIFLDFAPEDVGSILSVIIDDKKLTEIELTSALLKSKVALSSLSFNITNLSDGLHTLQIKLTHLTSTTIKFYNTRLSGSAITGSHVVRQRWRPIAKYANWVSTQKVGDSKAWIFEISSKSDFGHYSPITTNFGYFGPNFTAGGGVNGVNLSLWSYGAGQPRPPIYKLSHLLGIGSAKGTFSGYSHEGTGVKVRGWNIFDNNNSGTYVIGLRYTNDGNYTTFYGYFWNKVSRRWQLYTIGRKYYDNPITHLKSNSFVEVPGAAEHQRSNHSRRVVKYRGWLQDKNGVWSEVDRMQSVLGGDELHTGGWRVLEEGRFEVSTGGFAQRSKSVIPKYFYKEPSETLPIYMTPTKLKAFTKVPFKPFIRSMEFLTNQNKLKLDINTATTREGKLTVCWGETDAMTLQEFWDHCKDFVKPVKVKNMIVEVPATVMDKFARVLVRDSKAQMWSFETKTF